MTQYYAAGVLAEAIALPHPDGYPGALWVHTGIQWIPLSPQVAQVWRTARHRPVDSATIRAALAADDSTVSSTELFWWTLQRRLWMTWPLTADPYHAHDALAWWHLVPLGPAPDSALAPLWGAAPSLARLIDLVRQTTDWPSTTAEASVLQQVAAWVNAGAAHWLYGPLSRFVEVCV